MAGKRKKIVDIYARLQHLRAGVSNRGIKRDLGATAEPCGNIGNGPRNMVC